MAGSRLVKRSPSPSASSSSGSSLLLDKMRRIAGDITLNSTNWANVDAGLDMTLTGVVVGDQIMYGINARVDVESVVGFFDVVTVVGGTATNSFAVRGAAEVAPGTIVSGWRIDASTQRRTVTGDAPPYTVVAGDLTAGTITLRLRYATGTAANLTLKAGGDDAARCVGVQQEGAPPLAASSVTSGRIAGTFGADDLLPSEAKIRGVNLTPKASQWASGASGDGWSVLWEFWDATWMEDQLDDAVAFGCNVVRVMGSITGLYRSNYTRAAYYALWDDLNTMCETRGLYLYPCMQPGGSDDSFSTLPQWYLEVEGEAS